MDRKQKIVRMYPPHVPLLHHSVAKQETYILTACTASFSVAWAPSLERAPTASWSCAWSALYAVDAA
jgi:hypothetical protein